MHTTPASLLERLREPGEPGAWEQFVELYTPLLYHWGRRAGLQEADAADLVQDVLTTLLRKLPEFVYQPGKSFRSWLRTVTLNRWRDRMKQLGRRPHVEQGATLTEVADPTAPEAFWEAEYRQHLVGRALQVMRSQFEPATWRACWEVVVHGRTASQVASELGISENAVRIAKLRVLRRLRTELEGMLD